MQGRDTMNRAMGAFALILLVGLGTGCKKDEEEDNQKCESECVGDYADGIESCTEDATECLAGCSGPDDIPCTWDCEDLQDECMFKLTICASRCPCAKDVASCARSCPDYGACEDACAEDDTACQNDCLTEFTNCASGCEEDYTDCAGEDSPYYCFTTDCQLTAFQCTSMCEQLAYSSQDFTDCRASCAEQIAACARDCE